VATSRSSAADNSLSAPTRQASDRPFNTSPHCTLHGADDGLVAEADSRQLYGEIASTDKALRIYPRMMHEILNEFRKDIVIDDVVDWIQQRI
jgi:alpha-beta hydrolase superfamily lysophospholipase